MCSTCGAAAPGRGLSLRRQRTSSVARQGNNVCNRYATPLRRAVGGSVVPLEQRVRPTPCKTANPGGHDRSSNFEADLYLSTHYAEGLRVRYVARRGADADDRARRRGGDRGTGSCEPRTSNGTPAPTCAGVRKLAPCPNSGKRSRFSSGRQRPRCWTSTLQTRCATCSGDPQVKQLAEYRIQDSVMAIRWCSDEMLTQLGTAGTDVPGLRLRMSGLDERTSEACSRTD
jgi:hypothetical protein